MEGTVITVKLVCGFIITEISWVTLKLAGLQSGGLATWAFVSLLDGS